MPGIGDILAALGGGLEEVAKGVATVAPYAYKPYRDYKLQEFFSMRQAKAQEEKERKQRVFQVAREMAKEGNLEGLQLVQGSLSPQVMEALSGQAEDAAERNKAFNNLVASLVQAGGQTAAVPSTPGAGAGISGTPGSSLEIQSVAFTPGKPPRITAGRPTGEQQKFRGRQRYREASQTIEQNLLAQGVDPTQARIQAANMARFVPGAIPTEEGRELLSMAGAPAGAPSGLSPAALGEFMKAAGRRAGQLAASRDLERPDREAFNNAGASLRSLDRLRRLYLRVQEKAGPARGRYTRMRDYLDLESGAVREFIQARRAVRDTLRRQVTGAAASFQELGRIEQRIPSLNDSPEKFEAGLSAAVNEVNDVLQKTEENLKAQRFLVPGALTEVPEGLQQYLDAVEDQVPKSERPKVTPADEKWAKEFVNRLKKGQ